MRLTSLLTVIACSLLFTGCDIPTPSLLSVNPVVADKDVAVSAELSGIWENPDGKGGFCLIRPGEHGGYDLAYFEGGGNLTSFNGQLFRLGDVELMDVTPSDDNDFRIPGHAIARIWISGASLRWAFLDSDWFKQQMKLAPTYDAGGKLLLIAPQAAVRELLLKNAGDDRAYQKSVTWRRGL